VLKGFVTTSSAPAPSAATLSASAFRTVSMMIAMFEWARIALQTSTPPMSGMLNGNLHQSAIPQKP
jgi:hypothetical protein